MARRASSQTKPKTVIIVVGTIIALGLGGIVLKNTVFNKTASIDRSKMLPLDDFFERSSILRDNTYLVEGTIEERFAAGDGELVSLGVKLPDSKELRFVPIFVESDVKKVNLERQQRYLFEVKILNKGSNRGVAFATKITNL